MIINQKKIAQVILSKRNAQGAETSAPVETQESSDPRHAIAEDLMLAVKNGNAQGVVDALSAWDATAESAEDDAGEE